MMKHNQIKIISNSGEKTLSYFFRNEKEEWNLVSNASALSRKKYVTASIKEHAVEILQIINDIYNIGNRGVDIYFEGSKNDFDFLCCAINENFVEYTLNCLHQKTAVAVAGKIGSGKTTLIEELIKVQGKKHQLFYDGNITGYKDSESAVTWYEIRGIDLGKENVEAAIKKFDQLAKNGVTNFIYCFRTIKIEDLEEQFIRHVREKSPGVKILIVHTLCLEDDADILLQHLKETVGEVKVIPTLAKEFKSREGILSPYGLDEIIQYLFEGK